MKLHFVKMNPVENMTIFVLDQLPRESYHQIANKLMDYSNVHGEQVGFVETSGQDRRVRLQMMGGEFCGNASRSLAAYLTASGHPLAEKKGDKYHLQFEVSGMDSPVRCIVKAEEGQDEFTSGIHMPLPSRISKVQLESESTAIDSIRVDFQGISHFIVDSKKIGDEIEVYNQIKKEMEKEDFHAFGVMFYDYDKEFLKPLVYVRETDSLYWERSCASGSCAVASALSFQDKRATTRDIFQPGGKLRVSIQIEGDTFTGVFLDGPVQLVAEGICYL